MLHNILKTWRTAALRLSYSRRVLIWLFTVAWRRERGRLLASATLGLASLALQIAPLMLFVHVVSHIEVASTAYQTPSIASIQFPHGTLILIAVAMLIASGLAQYQSRILALKVEQNSTKSINASIISSISCFPGTYAAWRKGLGIDVARVFRVVLADSRSAAMVIRLALFNIVHAFYLFAGLAFLLFVSPILFAVTFAMSFLGLIVAYPLNVRAAKIGRDFRALGATRTVALQERIRHALSSAESKEPAYDTHTDEIDNPFLEMQVQRLSIVELTRLVFAVFFALMIGVFAWLLISRQNGLPSVSMLLMLLFAFRYTISGFQGLMILSASINRHWPAIVATFGLINDLEHRSSRYPHRQTSSGNSKPTTFKWAIAEQSSPLREGTFGPGQSYFIVHPSDPPDDLGFLLLDRLVSHHEHFAKLYDESIAAFNAALAMRDKDASWKLGEPRDDADDLEWIAKFYANLGWPETTEKIALMLAGDRSSKHPGNVARELAMLRRQIKSGSYLLHLRRPTLFKLDMTAQAAELLKQETKHHLVMATVPWRAWYGSSPTVAEFVLSTNGTSIVYSQISSSMAPSAWQTLASKGRICRSNALITPELVQDLITPE